MHVVATAGHVDHGKSALVRALTGAEPDRLRQERDRGLSIELGYVWTALPDAGEVAFVDVPGHGRFISTALGGFGPVPAVLLVVAADDGVMPQTLEHLAALDGLDVRHAVVAITRSDLADPEPARAEIAEVLAGTSLAEAPIVAVSAHTGHGLAALRTALARMLAGVPQPDPGAPVRLWVDRSFTMTGAGPVVTGTLPAGRVRTGDQLCTDRGRYRVRSVQSLGRPVPAATGVARVALNISGDVPIERGQVVLTPGAWRHTESVDVRMEPADPVDGARPPREPLMHIGSTVLSTRCRELGPGVARLTLATPLPLRIGDRAVLRDPGSRRLWGIRVLDPAPPPLRRRGAGAQRAQVLSRITIPVTLSEEVRRRGLVSFDLLRRIGVDAGATPSGMISGDGWLLSQERAMAAARAAADVVAAHAERSPLAPGLTLAALAEQLGLPTAGLAEKILGEPLQARDGRVFMRGDDGPPAEVREAVAALEAELAPSPFAAPTAGRLAELGLDDQVRGAAVRAGLIIQPAPGVVLMDGADETAARALAELPQPFTTSQARRHLGTSRRVVLALLGHLDRTGRTRRLPDDRRQVSARP